MLARFVAASGLTNLADGIAVVVWGWLGSLLTRDPILITVLPIALRLPWFLFAIPAGIITDRFDRRHLILWMDTARAALFLIVALSVWGVLPLAQAPASGVSSPGLFATLAITALLIGLAEVIRDNAAQTMLPALVGKDRLEGANGKLLSVELIGNSLLGPALGAFLIAAFLPLPFALNAIAFALAAVLIFRMKGRFHPGLRARNDWKAELGEAWRFLMAAPTLKLLAIATGVWNLIHQMVVIALILYVQETLSLGAPAYGLILAAGALGGILIGAFSESIVQRLGRGRCAQWATLVTTLAFAAIPLAPGAWALAFVFFISEGVGLIWNTVSVSYRQRTIPAVLLGRVNSLYRLMAWGMMPVGLLLAGLLTGLAEHQLTRETAIELPFFVAGLAGIALTFAIWKPLGRAFS